MKKNIIIAVIVLLAVATLVFTISREDKEVPKVKGPRVAIVIDDWGYSLRGLKTIKEIKFPLIISILPNLKYSSRIALEAQQLNQEIILHFPMQPDMGNRKIGLERDTVNSTMSDEEIRHTLERALGSVAYAKGVSNHMGSLATQDKRIMSAVLKELKKRDLFFLDSLSSSGSVGGEIANELNLKFVSRDFFLDNLDDKEYIREQLQKVNEFAQEFGMAIAIGHARPKTLEVLAEQMPLLDAEGIRFVFISDLIE